MFGLNARAGVEASLGILGLAWNLTVDAFPGASLVIQFWLLADNFESNFESSPETQRKEDVMGIYNRFISLQAPEPLGVRAFVHCG